MHGDYEAQRHWQEVTLNLPLTEWYNQTEVIIYSQRFCSKTKNVMLTSDL